MGKKDGVSLGGSVMAYKKAMKEKEKAKNKRDRAEQRVLSGIEKNDPMAVKHFEEKMNKLKVGAEKGRKDVRHRLKRELEGMERIKEIADLRARFKSSNENGDRKLNDEITNMSFLPPGMSESDLKAIKEQRRLKAERPSSWYSQQLKKPKASSLSVEGIPMEDDDDEDDNDEEEELSSATAELPTAPQQQEDVDRDLINQAEAELHDDNIPSTLDVPRGFYTPEAQDFTRRPPPPSLLPHQLLLSPPPPPVIKTRSQPYLLPLQQQQQQQLCPASTQQQLCPVSTQQEPCPPSTQQQPCPPSTQQQPAMMISCPASDNTGTAERKMKAVAVVVNNIENRLRLQGESNQHTEDAKLTTLPPDNRPKPAEANADKFQQNKIQEDKIQEENNKVEVPTPVVVRPALFVPTQVRARLVAQRKELESNIALEGKIFLDETKETPIVRETATISAMETPTVGARETATVTARETATVAARETATVTARETATVTAWDTPRETEVKETTINSNDDDQILKNFLAEIDDVCG